MFTICSSLPFPQFTPQINITVYFMILYLLPAVNKKGLLLSKKNDSSKHLIKL